MTTVTTTHMHVASSTAPSGTVSMENIVVVFRLGGTRITP